MSKHIKGWGEHLGGDADGQEEEAEMRMLRADEEMQIHATL